VFLFDMNQLFEDFDTRLTEHAFAGTDITVHPQARSRSILIDKDTGRPCGSIVPDLLLARGAGICGWRRVVDVKYKLHDRRGPDPTDIYQSILYAATLARPGTHPDPPTTILVHPGTPALAGDPIRRTAIFHQLCADLTR
jgi:5-methylcytosine-specific restriction endonuclease McrBC regulatory subunit McrC